MARDDEMASAFYALFQDDHALLNDLRFSDPWAEKLRGCQRRVLHHGEGLGGDLKHIISSLSFAAQMLESFWRPVFKVICLLVPIDVMLTMMAEHGRDQKAKKRREKV